MNYIDLSQPLCNQTPVYPGDEPLGLEPIRSFNKDGYSDFRLTTGMHVGTHIDGPSHMTSGLQSINNFAPEKFIGPGCLLKAESGKTIERKKEYGSLIKAGSIVVVYTGFGLKFGSEEYFTEYPAVDIRLAELLVEKRIKMLCLDTPSPEYPPYKIHPLLLENNILIAENLANVEKLLNVREFEIIALPLALASDSSPARIIARIPD